MTLPPDPPDDQGDPDLAAAEYVMGLLPPEQARAVEALALADPAVAASLRAWEARLLPLADAVPPVPAPRALWARLALATGMDRVRRRRPAALPAAGLWRSLALWRTLAFAGAAAAAALAFVATRPAPLPPPGFLAALSPAGAPGATFLVRIGENGAAVVIAAAPPQPAPGRSLELWSLASGAAAPVSLGLLPSSGSTVLHAPARAGTQLLVSDEPVGGSPNGQPTGPVVYKGIVTPGS